LFIALRLGQRDRAEVPFACMRGALQDSRILCNVHIWFIGIRGRKVRSIYGLLEFVRCVVV